MRIEALVAEAAVEVEATRCWTIADKQRRLEAIRAARLVWNGLAERVLRGADCGPPYRAQKNFTDRTAASCRPAMAS